MNFPHITIWLIFILLMLLNNFKSFPWKEGRVLVWLISYILVSAVIVRDFSIFFTFRLLFLFFIVFSIRKLYNSNEIINDFLAITSVLVKISLFFYIISFLFPINEWIKTLGIADGNGNYSIGVYQIKERAIGQNSGFCWEPGPYGVLSFFALIFEYTKTKRIVSRNNFFYFLAILTSQSTTAYGLLVLFVVWYYFVHKPITLEAIVGVVFISAGFIYAYGQLDFLGEKISEESMSAENSDHYLESFGALTDETVGVSRFVAFKISYAQLFKNPIVGTSHNVDLSYAAQNNLNVHGSSVFSFANFYGVPFYIFILKVFWNFGINVFKRFDIERGEYLWIIAILMTSISFSSVIYTMFFFSLIFTEYKKE